MLEWLLSVEAGAESDRTNRTSMGHVSVWFTHKMPERMKKLGPARLQSRHPLLCTVNTVEYARDRSMEDKRPIAYGLKWPVQLKITRLRGADLGVWVARG
jgi:hypothetical protein